MKTALITGITGQDGSFLAEFLLAKGYAVHGIMRRSSSFNTGRIEHLFLDEWVRDMKNKKTIGKIKRILQGWENDYFVASNLPRFCIRVFPKERKNNVDTEGMKKWRYRPC